jgi:hypothetical protein
MPTTADVQDRIQRFFRARSRTLLAAAAAAVTGHGTTSGSHRENEVREFLREILPGRFSVDHGLVFARNGKSREADVILWEAGDFPRIPQSESKIVFAESVRMIVEVKSDWSSGERDDIWKKSSATQALRSARSTTIEGRVAHIEDQLGTLYTAAGDASPFALKARRQSRKERLSFAGVVLRGGQTVKPPDLGEKLLYREASELPDLLLLLEAGHVIHKLYDGRGVGGNYYSGGVEFYSAGEDALLLFTSKLLEAITDQSEYLSHPFRLETYCSDVLRTYQPKIFDCAPLLGDAAAAIFHERPPPEVIVKEADE